jgi:hypothetical protein
VPVGSSIREYAPVTTGRDLVSGGLSLLVFSLLMLAHVHWLVPRMYRWFGKENWTTRRWMRRWNYGVPIVLGAIALATTLVGVVSWAAGWTYQ